MQKLIILILTLSVLFSCKQKVLDTRTQYFPKVEIKQEIIPDKDNLWVFILVGQSNMAGRGLVEPQDTLPEKRILTINRDNEIIVAKEPLHFYEPLLTGLDCGLSFGKTMIRHLPDSISVLILPAAVGGSSISQWLGDSVYRDVRLLTNFRQMVGIGKKYGQVKGIMWHQGESDTNPADIPLYRDRLYRLHSIFRNIVGDEKLPVIIGGLGSFSDNNKNWMKINEQILLYASGDSNVRVVNTYDLVHKGDKIHFNSESQRVLGKRYAEAYLEVSNN